MENLKIYLKVTAPVHIGCDDVYEPTGFRIDERRKKLIAFDPLQFVKSLAGEQRQKFTDLCSKGTIASIPEIYRFISRTDTPGREVDIAAGLPETYSRVIKLAVARGNDRNIKQELNKFSIKRTAYNPHSDQPYIPGSSLKGALRTAYLNMRALEDRVRNRQGRGLEDTLLQGSFNTDPFRCVKVSDFLPVGNVKTKIVYAVNKKKMPSKYEAKGPTQIFEVILPGAVFEGTLTLVEPPAGSGIKRAVTKRDLFDSARRFYESLFKQEHELVKTLGGDCSLYVDTTPVLNGSAFMLRAGRHSGAESVTIENNRNIKIMQGKNEPPRYLDHATTVWLASERSNAVSNSELVPFGWLLFSTEPLQPLELEPQGQSTPADAVAHDDPPPTPEKTLLEKLQDELKLMKPNEAGRIGPLIDRALVELLDEQEKKEFAQAVKTHMGSLFKKSKAKTKLTAYLG